MTLQVWRYPVLLGEPVWFAHDIPAGAEFLTVAADGSGGMSLYFEVDAARPRERRRFCVVGTGQALEPAAAGNRWAYLGTFKQAGMFVWHVYGEVAA